MVKSLKEQLSDTRRDHEVSYIVKFNNGRLKKEKVNKTKNMDPSYDTNSFVFDYKWAFKSIAQCLSSYHIDFDYVSVNLLVGLMYNPEDYINGKLKEDAKPVEDVVSVYIGKMDALLKNRKRIIDPMYKLFLRSHKFVNYNELIESFNKEGIVFDGPKSFDELVERITSNETFDIKGYIDLKNQEELTQEENGPVLTRKKK
jgi:hypothetical protein